MESTLGNCKISSDMVLVDLYGTITMYMKENGIMINDMVLVFLCQEKVEFIKESGLMVIKKQKK